MHILNIGAPFLVSSFRELGHAVFSVGLNAGCDMRLAHPVTISRVLDEAAARGFTPDAVVWVDNGNLPAVFGMETVPLPSCFYAIDSYCNPWHVGFSYGFDVVCVAQKGYLEIFPTDARAPHVEWLPLFAPDRLAQEVYPGRDIPVSFVGTLNPKNIPQRMPFLEAFRARHPIVFRQGDYEPWFRRSHIVLNQTAFREVNFRCFEAMACGAALLTEQGEHGLEELFTPGEHILPPYEAADAAKAAAECAAWLGNGGALQEVQQAGRNCVCEQHLARHRAARIGVLLEEAREEGRFLSRPEDVQRKKLFAGAYGMLAAELTDAAFARHRELYSHAFDQAWS